ncbi:lipopolysaccharide biosynthesis protein [Nakamurella deserti]|uniref:lipopolysaccharide biosynthesis protein n=1 Tax=Nakamurella deserti TaxID=2164074 RepID=UPI001300817B|nr:oligosaccharide flippase family protein [Nakamurella deserti]
MARLVPEGSVSPTEVPSDDTTAPTGRPAPAATPSTMTSDDSPTPPDAPRADHDGTAADPALSDAVTPELASGTPVTGPLEHTDTVPAPPAADTDAQKAHKAGASSSALFGRGMLYVVVASLQLVTGAFVSPVMTRLLDTQAFGQLTTAIALHQLLIVAAIVGLDQAIVLKRAEDGHDRNVRALASTSILIATAVTAVLAATSPWWSVWLGFDPGSQLLVLITVLWTIPSAGVMVQLALLLTNDRLKAYATVSVLAAVGGQIAGITAVLVLGRQSSIYAWGLLGADLLATLIGWTLTRPTLKRAFSWELIKPSLLLGAPLMLGSLSSFVLNAGDRIIVQSLLGAVEVGRYQIAYTVGFVAVQLIGLTSSAWTPRFAAVRDRALRWRIIGSSRDSIFALLSPVVLGIVLAAPILLRVVAPARYELEPLLFVSFLVLISAYPVAASGASGRILITSRRAKPLAAWAAAAALLNVALNFALVPPFGIAGAAGATLVAYTLQSFGLRWSVGNRAEWPSTPPRILAQAAAVILIGAGSTALPQSTAWNIARLVLALACLPWAWIQLQRTRRAG